MILARAGAHKKRQGEKRIFLAFSRKKFAKVQLIIDCDLSRNKLPHLNHRYMFRRLDIQEPI